MKKEGTGYVYTLLIHGVNNQQLILINTYKFAHSLYTHVVRGFDNEPNQTIHNVIVHVVHNSLLVLLPSH